MKTQLKLALKILTRRKAFTAISLFGISMTLAVLMVATAILDHLFQARAPETRLDRTLVITHISQSGEEGSMTSPPGYALLDRFVRTLPNIELASIYTPLQSAALYREGARLDVMVRRTDGDYWKLLDYRFLEGGPYTADDDASGRLVAVINDDLRQKLFDGNAAVGRTIQLEGRSFRIIGVVPRASLTQQIAYGQMWLPIGTLKSSEYRNQYFGDFYGAVLVKDRRLISTVQREFESRLSQVPPSDPKQFPLIEAGLDTPFESFARMFAGNRSFDRKTTPRTVRTILGVLALLFMALPALNLITLNLSRILERGPEIGVRRSFGAPRSALVRQFVFENVVMTVIGGVIGFALAGALLPILNRLAPLHDANLTLNVRVFAWGMVLAVIFGMLSGVYPAWRMSRLHPVNALRGGSQ